MTPTLPCPECAEPLPGLYGRRTCPGCKTSLVRRKGQNQLELWEGDGGTAGRSSLSRSPSQSRGGLRVQRLCGHWTPRPEAYLCPLCLLTLQTTGCDAAECEGYVVPLPPCPCQVVYFPGGEAREIMVRCDYCHTAVHPTTLRSIRKGRWLRRQVEVGRDRFGNPIMETKSIPTIVTLQGCEECQALMMKAEGQAPEGSKGWLPWR